MAVYKIGQQFMLKEAQRTTMTFTTVNRTEGDGPRYPVCDTDINLKSGDLYTALQPPKEGSLAGLSCHHVAD